MSDENANQESLEKLEELIESNFHNSMISAASEAIVGTHEVFDKFSSWLLVGSGATAALIIVNVDKIVPYVSQYGLRWGILLLTISALFGFCAKYFEIAASASQKVGQDSTTLMTEKMKAYEDALERFDNLAEKSGFKRSEKPQFENFLDDFIKLFPYGFMRRKIARMIYKDKERLARGNSRAVWYVVHQSFSVFLQSLFYLLFLVTMSLSVHFVS
ncbi:hypothetical protein I4P27_10985 [Enterobacter roggenkampii]|nr:hypothetical protein [Enterobacter roggenkampii]